MTEATAAGGSIELQAFDTRAAYPGKGLLSDQWEQGADWLVNMLRASYDKIGEQKGENLVLWNATRKHIVAAVQSRLDAIGLWAPRMDLDALLLRLAPEHPPPNGHEHVQLLRAFMTDYADHFWQHIDDRLSTEANLHFELVGATGSGKSSCAITIADWMKRIEPTKLLEHLNFDLGELQNKLRHKKPCESVIQDEFLQLSGEGARTAFALFQNLEDTLRQSQVNLLVCSPRRHEHGTMQARLESIAQNRRAHYTAFLVYKDETPMGLVAIPWAREELYRVYRDFKDRNVERSLSGAFQDHTWAVRTACRFFEDERMCDWLRMITYGRQYRKTDFERAVSAFQSDMMSGSQVDRVATMMFEMATTIKRAEADFEYYWEVKPNAGIRRIARSMEATEEEAGAGA